MPSPGVDAGIADASALPKPRVLMYLGTRNTLAAQAQTGDQGFVTFEILSLEVLQ